VGKVWQRNEEDSRKPSEKRDKFQKGSRRGHQDRQAAMDELAEMTRLGLTPSQYRSISGEE